MKGQDYELVNALMQLLEETQGRAYGLPQLLDPSDRLSEVYIDRVERALIRAGFHTWRYNDDFRIGCRDYPETLDAIEHLDVWPGGIGKTDIIKTDVAARRRRQRARLRRCGDLGLDAQDFEKTFGRA